MLSEFYFRRLKLLLLEQICLVLIEIKAFLGSKFSKIEHQSRLKGAKGSETYKK